MSYGCFTSVEIKMPKKNTAKRLYNLILDWLGDEQGAISAIVAKCGVSGLDIPESYRGTIKYLDYDDELVTFTMDTPWVPVLSIWLKIIDKYAPEAKLYYESWEPINQLCVTNRRDNTDFYYVEYHDGGLGEYSCSQARAMQIAVSGILSAIPDYSFEGKDDDDIVEFANQIDAGVTIKKWRYVPADEWD